MSTFKGVMGEFPDIRVDFFRKQPDGTPPLACFLSHIHSDHLAGLESLRSPFVYCSHATKEMLLRIERFPCRINYAKGILEARVQRYKHLKNLLKPLPLETPTVLELAPGHKIQVTLFDANHCPGAVMFLFEGHGKAALYTGDIRSEPWFVNAIARSPPMIEFTSGLKTLDTVYLDTSFIDNVAFPSKAEGIRELLQSVARYQKDTIFHLQAWTYGYEDVWIALSKALNTKIHVDDYKMLVYGSLIAKDSAKFGTQFHFSREAAALMGFMCGNTHHAGCLTTDESVRLHSCEKGNYCQTVLNSPVVRIQPIIARHGGLEVAEIGVGGGGDDLNRDAELDYLLPADIGQLLEALCGDEQLSGQLKEQVRLFLAQATASNRQTPLNLDMTAFGDKNETGIGNLFQAIVAQLKESEGPVENQNSGGLPKVITFPYSRHSSYPELCHLLDTFKPSDVWPCTVDPRVWLDKGICIKGLFGEHCSGNVFRHDAILEEMRQTIDIRTAVDVDDSQVTTVSASFQGNSLQDPFQSLIHEQPVSSSIITQNQAADDVNGSRHTPRDITYLQNSQASVLSEQAYNVRASAFHAVLQSVHGDPEAEINLICTSDNHFTVDQELGEE
ncbi:hypothetical protein OQA88_9050 [Cercophora sp. LCS_1]